uniref:Uncharacterized protein n=1 Tax=Myotis myotis TaxID=51298 RepID=A0A7J7V3T3_MYOMY|nr:hypothetical protein mMyoMyo1_008461 [Myotis myotis]
MLLNSASCLQGRPDLCETCQGRDGPAAGSRAPRGKSLLSMFHGQKLPFAAAAVSFPGKSRSHAPGSTKTTEVFFAKKTPWLPKFPPSPRAPSLPPSGTRRNPVLSTRRIFGTARARCCLLRGLLVKCLRGHRGWSAGWAARDQGEEGLLARRGIKTPKWGGKFMRKYTCL